MNNNEHLFLPEYNAKSPTAWFINVEVIFGKISNISEETKFSLVKDQVAKNVNFLPEYIQKKVYLIFNSTFQTGFYEKLKNALLSEPPTNFDFSNKSFSGVIASFGSGGIKAGNVKITAPKAKNSGNHQEINAAVIKGDDATMKFKDVDINVYDDNKN